MFPKLNSAIGIENESVFSLLNLAPGFQLLILPNGRASMYLTGLVVTVICKSAVNI
jgi:hypothetical protein